MNNQEAWKRAQFADNFHGLKILVQMYEDHKLDQTQLVENVTAWCKHAKENRPSNPQLLAKLRTEWMQTEDIEVLRKYQKLGLTTREMGEVCGVSASAVSRWLNGNRTKKSKKIKDPTLKELIERANR